MAAVAANASDLVYAISPSVTDDELNDLFTTAWLDHRPGSFQPILQRSLAYVCAYHTGQLVGFVNIAWDGGVHGFILDTTVHAQWQRRGVGKQLLQRAQQAAREHHIEWLHVDYEPHLYAFYHSCGFHPTMAGLIDLREQATEH